MAMNLSLPINKTTKLLLPPCSLLHGGRSRRNAMRVCASFDPLRSRIFPRDASSSSIGKQPVGIEPRARFSASRTQTVEVRQLRRPLADYMSLPASQYSVLDAERIERVDDNTFRCYVYRFKFFAFEVCPVLLVRVEEEPKGCCIRLLSCKLEGSPFVVAQNEKFSASMVNKISCSTSNGNSSVEQLKSETTIEVAIGNHSCSWNLKHATGHIFFLIYLFNYGILQVVIEIPFAFRAIPEELIESTGNRVLEQLLGIMLPRFMAQKDNGGCADHNFWRTGELQSHFWFLGELKTSTIQKHKDKKLLRTLDHPGELQNEFCVKSVLFFKPGA
ncbi:hypothetical protein AMTRI_Chr07g79630 [Amborella trichopoda]